MGSTLLLDESYDTQGAGFVDLLRACDDDRRLAGLADRMLKDSRPWVRTQLLAYLETPFDRPGHHPLVKRVFKDAERRGDIEFLVRCLVGFDRAVRRKLVHRRQYDWQTRAVTEVDELVLSRRGLLAKHPAKHAQAKPVRRVRERPGMALFSLATRLYLRRRAWRYFRHLGFQKPESYIPAAADIARRYTDADLNGGQDLLDSWGLAHVLFGDSDVLQFQGTWINITPERSLADVRPSPAFTTLWQTPTAVPHLLSMATTGQAKLVRTWAFDWMKAHHPTALAALGLDDIRRMFDAEWEDVRLVGLDLFAKHPQVPTMTVQQWLGLLHVTDPSVLAQIVTAMQAHVRGSRLSHAEAVALACHRSVPVVRMALAFLAEKRWDGPAETEALLGLARAACPALAEELGRFLLERLGTAERYRVEYVCTALDHRLEGMRTAAMAWVDGQRHVREDAQLWARAAESPHDQVRCWLLRALERFVAEATVSGDQRRLLWTTVLLGVHRGGREKQAAVRQLTAAIVADPDGSGDLLPLLAAALRSLRLPERRAACAGIATVLVRRPALAPRIAALFPELDCSQVVLEAG
jgi:hypothetical protein